MAAPKYRDEIKGNVASHIADFRASVAGEIRTSHDFILAVEDTDAFDEYKDYLTFAEMNRAFKAVL